MSDQSHDVPSRRVQVAVFDQDGTVLDKATVILKRTDPASKAQYDLKFDPTGGAYVAAGVEPGRYLLTAKAPEQASDERNVQVDPAGLQATVILGTPGLPFLYRGAVKTPFRPYPNLVAVVVEPRAAAAAAEQLSAAARQLKLTPVEVAESIRRQRVSVFQFAAGTPASEHERVVEALGRLAEVQVVGPIVKRNPDSLSMLTNEIVAKFHSHITVDEIPAIAKRFNLQLQRALPQAGNAFLFRAPGPVTYAMLDIVAKLVDSGLVEYAEPNLISTVVDDAINPTDFLFPMQWHLPLIHCPDAWQAINDNIDPSLAFGSPNVVIAVVDSGVDVLNPDFTGTVSNGATKVYQAFDFQNMVANNTSRQGGHGTCCAGIATAPGNNASGVAGQNEGVSGSAGNCRLLAVERPFPGSEVAYSDMYIWTGGFNPGSTAAGFPAPISPGADVMTNSFGFSIGMAISGLMKDTFDYLTTYGRGGRGTLLFFSAGNAGVDFTLVRPWAAYTRTFAVAASSLGTDGVTEVHAPYSNFAGPTSTIDFCAPSDRPLGGPYNPPLTYGTITVADRTSSDFPPNAPSHFTAQTTTSAASAAGATSLTVASSAAFAVGQFVVVGTPGTAGADFGMVTAIPNATHVTVTALNNAHASGAQVFGGPGNSFNSFGGTSSATPLAAGVGALMISVRPTLTWIQVRDILRGTAVHIDAANTNPTGIWTDVNGVASNAAGYLGPHYSRWYGFGRIDAAAAVNDAIVFGTPADVIVRENLGDNGSVPSVGRFWDSPDIWVRNLSPAAEGAAALPATYATPGPTQDAIAGQDNYIYVRLKNIGPVPTSDFFVRVYLTHWAGTEFVYPNDFIPTNHPGQPLPSPLTTGTYLIGEVQHVALAPNAVDTVNVVWPQAAIPPKDVTVGMVKVHWHPCLLVEISPQDGPLATGVHVWDNNNLAQKNVSIVYSDADGFFRSALVLGNLFSRSEIEELLIDRTMVPQGVRLYVDVLDPKVKRSLTTLIRECGDNKEPCPPTEVVLLEDVRVQVTSGGGRCCVSEAVMTLPAKSHLTFDVGARHGSKCPGVAIGWADGREVFWLDSTDVVRVPLMTGAGALVPIVIGGVVLKEVEAGEYLIGVTQRASDGSTSGSAAVQLRVR